ncbi:ankyrin repeat protein [Leptospira wolbachii serovar Codice str. CDC]|uniref:Ankyrin repeat protein n=1 Tax=Leptospira wolbachii serovar Codice str. CDC TaxID=1218599 RepID=R8ZYR9_9LEPT|nr:ankyrin repeat domain-containing protein [Leptospira wolbachii]EOQ94884.1 ankyrin repeat protein [Leptospira wolbachii serovar Codice str. CDC]
MQALSNCATPIIKAIDANDIAKIQQELDKGADINEYKVFYYTPIIRAVLAGKKDLVEYLISKGADPNGRGSGQWGPNRLIPTIYIATTLGDGDMVKLLLSKGANPALRAEYQWTRSEAPYHNYEPKGNALNAIVETTKAYEQFVQSGNVAPDNTSEFQKEFKVYQTNSTEIAKILIRDKRVLDDSENLASAFVGFLKIKQTDIANLIFDSIPQKSIDNRMYHQIIQIYRSDFLKKLLAKSKPLTPLPGEFNLFEYAVFMTGGGDNCLPNTSGGAIKFDHFKNEEERIRHANYANYQMVVETLSGIYSAKAVDNHRRNYITQQILKNNLYQFSCLTALVKTNKININSPDKYGWAPIHYAVLYSSYEEIEKLLLLGANPDIKTKEVPEDQRSVYLRNGFIYHPRPNISAKEMALTTNSNYQRLFKN